VLHPVLHAKEDRPIRSSAALSAGFQPGYVPPRPAGRDEFHDLLRKACSELLRRSILTLAALPDREKAWLSSPRSSMPDYVQEASAYASEAPRVRRFQPSPEDIGRYLDVLAWLSWLGRQNDGARDVKIITARTFGTPMWKLAERFGRSDETIRRWEIAAIDRVAHQFREEILRMC
jgi:hypothetical protein